ncbi:MAG TPA: hypothetical protein VGJ75_24005, partial [Dongiaceae bacterium]
LLEDARRHQMASAAYRSLVDARKRGTIADLRTRLRRSLDALRYLPLNPLRWVRWLRRGTLRRRLCQRFEAYAIAASGGFDSAWYTDHYADVAKSAVDPLMHFVRFGAAEGRDPAPSCSTKDHLHAMLDAGEKAERRKRSQLKNRR